MEPTSQIRIGSNHRRALASTLSLLDEMLCRFEAWARGREVRGALYLERNNLSASQREGVLAEVTAIRERIECLRCTLGLPTRTHDAANDIWSWCSVLWKDVEELESQHLKRYGSLPEGAAEFIDPQVRAISAGLERLSTLVAGDGRKG